MILNKLKITIHRILLFFHLLLRIVKIIFINQNHKGYGLYNCDIYYINLDHRTDRKKDIQDEFHKLNLFNYKRISAVKKSNGALGCAISHKLVYEKSLQSNNLILVCEDDVSFLLSKAQLDDLINSFYNDSKLDVLCLAYNALYTIKINNDFYISSNIQTMACYVIKPHVLNEFIKMANVSIEALNAGKSEEIYAIDQVWKRLQNKYIFALPIERAVIQRPSYSDIRNVNVDYNV